MKKIGIVFLFAMVIAVVAFSCKKKAEDVVLANNTLIFAIEGDPGNDINTISTGGRYDLTEERLIYSPLLDYFGPDDIKWLLAESAEIKNVNPTSVVYKLRRGVKWSDGAPFTADDVIFTFEHIIKTDYANGHDNFVFAGNPVVLTKIDDWTLRIDYPVFVPNPFESSSAEHYIMPKHYYEGDAALDNNPKNQKPVGTGPYILSEYKAGQYVKLTANENYFGGVPKIKTIILQIIGDLNAAKLTLQKGEINIMPITVADAENFKKTLNIYSYPESRVGYFSFNLASPRVQDINFRKAAFWAIDRDAVNKAVYQSKEYYHDAISIFPYDNPFYTDKIEAYGQNLTKAKEYLAKVPGTPPVIRIAYGAPNAQLETQALVIQQNLKAAGINAEIKAIDGTFMSSELKKGSQEFDAFLSGYIMGIDASNYAPLFTSTGGANWPKWNDKNLDALWAAGAVENDQDKRRAIYDEIQRYVADTAVFYPLVTNFRILGVTKNVGGIEDARLMTIYTFEDWSKLFFKQDVN